MKEHQTPKFRVGDNVSKLTGDYTFHGTVLAVFRKRSGAIRMVVEKEAGILHVFSEQQLTLTAG